MHWETLLDGELAETATAAIRSIGEAIAAAPSAAPATDRTIFWAYASTLIDDPTGAYDAAIDELARELERGYAHPALFGGLAGAGWTLGHVMDGGADDALTVVDEALVRMLAGERWPGHHDLTQGLVGYGVYFLERRDAPRAREGLAHVVRHLARAATATGDGVAWHSHPDLLPSFYRDSWPDGFYDVGVAHGAPGAIALLARASGLVDGARALCDEAVRWIAHQRLPAHPHGRFPSRITHPAATGARSRAAWCYGDPGIAAALWSAAPSLALETARDCAARAPDTCGVRDAGLCHGAAGLAHLYNRFYQATGERAFADAARSWFSRALEMRRPDGFGGFVAWQGTGPADPAPDYRPVASLLEGSLGIGLALIAAVAPAEPCWDRLLLCDLEGGRS